MARCMLAAALTATFLAPVLAADGWNTFGSKSVNLGSAPAVTAYATSAGGSLNLEDAHATVGIPLASGGYIFAGKAMECADVCAGAQSQTKNEGFAVKLNAAGEQVWGWRSNVAGLNDAINGVAELPSGEIIVVGWRTVGSVGKRAMTKLSATGAEVWTFTDFGDVAGSNGALELVTLAGTTHLLISGFKEKATTDEMAFKSYGNAPGGKAWFCKMPVSAVAPSSAPAVSDITWDKTEAAYNSCKSAMALPGGNVVALLWGEDAGKSAGLVLYASDGASNIWGPVDHGVSSKLEGTDIAIATDGTKIAMSGHGGYLSDGLHYSGKLVIVNAADGLGKTTTEITAGGTHVLIYNECWGTDAVSGGFVVACGTGIEGCDHEGVSSTYAADCAAGKGDTSTPQLLFGPELWLSMVAKVDLTGTLEWQRADTFRADGATVYTAGNSFTATSSSASEWVVANADGTTAFVNDESDGFGLMLLAASEAGAGANPSPTAPGSTGPSPGTPESGTVGRHGWPVGLAVALVACLAFDVAAHV